MSCLVPLPARAEDEPEIRALLVQCGLPVQHLVPGHGVEYFVVRDHHGLVAVGGLEVHGNCGLMRSIAVLPSRRREGHARALAAVIEARAKACGLCAMYLLTETAAECFAALGYRVIVRETVPDALKVSAQFARVCPSSAICMRKQLSVATADM